MAIQYINLGLPLGFSEGNVVYAFYAENLEMEQLFKIPANGSKSTSKEDIEYNLSEGTMCTWLQNLA